MGTKVQCESYFPGYFSMRDLNEDSNSCSWPPFYGDKTFTNGQYYNDYLPRVVADAYPANDKDVVKRTMLKHEAIFRKQLQELHRLYRIQRDLMDEIKRKEPLKNRLPVETSFSSSPLASQVTSEDARKWHIPSFPLANSICARPSVLGVEDIHSPLSSMKGSSAQASPLPSQNGGTSKDVEILESRPSKVRRRMFDLQLPADEYIDTEEGEKLRDENSSYLPSRNHKIAPQNEIILFLGNCGKNNSQVDASRSESCLRSPINVGDLNKPVEVEEANASAHVDPLGCASSQAGSQGHELASKPKQELLGFPKEISANFRYRGDNETLNIPHMQNNANGKCWFPCALDSGHSKNNLKSVSPDLQPEKPTSSQPIQVLFSKTREPPTFFLADQGKIDQLRDRTTCGSELSERNHENANSNYSESVIASHRPSPYPIGPPSDVGKPWCQSVSSWEMPAVSLSQKSMSDQMHQYLNSSATLSRSSLSSTQSHGVFGDQRKYNSNSTSNPSFASEMPNRNGFYHGSSSGSKEPSVHLPSGNYDYWNCASTNNGASEHFINHSSAKFNKSPNCMDLKSARDLNLNALDSSSNKVGIEVIVLDRKHEDHLAALPWLKAKPACKYECTAGMDLNAGGSTFLQSSLNQLSDKSEFGKGPNQIAAQNMKSTKCSNVVETSSIQGGDSSCRTILGFPIFEKPHVPKNEFSSFPSSSLALPQLSEEVEDSKKNMLLDINLPCDPAVPDLAQQTAEEVAVAAKEADTKVANFRFHIDLNSCISDDETSMLSSVPGSSAKVVAGIDLEAPAVPESEENTFSREEKAHELPLQPTEHKAESLTDELIRIAADAIVAISSSGYQNHLDDATCNPPEVSVTDPLHWFVEIVSSCGEDLESKFDAVLRAKDGEDNMETSWEFIDYFESMTLRLIETKEEDYMPKPLVPENLKLEDTGTTTVLTRSRRGQGRRGRQRRDFQRDILPGLGSLSRHEVTEDLQTFGGMMRATGHPWHSGLTRRNSTRNGCARGRRRMQVSPLPLVAASPPCTPLVQQLHNIEVGLEDRNLTGWGKTTRRPRRQRCPAGNPPSHPLT
ncbi:uncharacterized protein [Populus alba]|uniref:Uncharacterized protein n=1 Tax=Populus alba TaxID=43335 RepID=A0A4U5MYB6_POPAL|nr:uncharacterized protein LOC118042988 [Populus alba]TKR74382.1 hypothetical protein D5086_0000294150 [Populus alba]